MSLLLPFFTAKRVTATGTHFSCRLITIVSHSSCRQQKVAVSFRPNYTMERGWFWPTKRQTNSEARRGPAVVTFLCCWPRGFGSRRQCHKAVSLFSLERVLRPTIIKSKKCLDPNNTLSLMPLFSLAASFVGNLSLFEGAEINQAHSLSMCLCRLLCWLCLPSSNSQSST